MHGNVTDSASLSHKTDHTSSRYMTPSINMTITCYAY